MVSTLGLYTLLTENFWHPSPSLFNFLFRSLLEDGVQLVVGLYMLTSDSTSPSPCPVLFSPLQELGVSLASIDVDMPLTVALNLSDLGHREHILELLPAVAPLENRVRYVIAQGNEEGFFHIHQKEGLSYLHLARKQATPGTYLLEIISMPLYRKRELQKLEALKDLDYFTGELGQALKMRLQLHLF